MSRLKDDDLKHRLGLFSADRCEAAYVDVNGNSAEFQALLSKNYFGPPDKTTLKRAESMIPNISVVIPMRERGPVIKPVLDVLVTQLNPRNIVVVSDDSDDAAIECVRLFTGVNLVYRNDILDCLDWERLLPILKLDDRPVGKGVAVLAGYLAHYRMGSSGIIPQSDWIFQNDAELAEYKRYQCLQHLVAGLLARPDAMAVKTAKFGRTNERSMCMRSAMHVLAESSALPKKIRTRAQQIFLRLTADKWIQTGEFMLSRDMAMNRPFATGYLEETLTASFVEDLCASGNKGCSLKVANPNPRLDGANDDRKEAIMQQQVANFFLQMTFFAKPVHKWTLQDIQALNHGPLSQPILMSWIPPNDGPCAAEAVHNDRIIPSVAMLDQNNLVDWNKMDSLFTRA